MKTKIQMKMSYIMIILLSIFFSTSLQAQICPDGMTHYWKLDEGSSSTYSDLYGLNATCSNCPSPVSGVINNAQQFAQSTAVNVPSHNSFDWTGSFSIEFWMKTDPSSTCSGNQVVIGRDDSKITPSSNLHWWVGCWDGGKAAFVLMDKNGIISLLNDSNTFAKDITDGQWHHIVAVRDGGNNKILIYVDGVLEDSKIATYSTGFDSIAPINIGWINRTNEHHFVGTVDEIAIYNRALSETEILQHYNNGQNAYGYCYLPSYTLTITGSGNGSGTVTGSGINCTITSGVVNGDCTKTYDAGTIVTLNAIADSGSTFSGWSGNCSGTGSCNLTMDSDKNVIAQFSMNAYTLTVIKTGTGSGTVNVNGCSLSWTGNTGTCTVNSGTLITITGIADSGSIFSGWSNGSGSAINCSGNGTCSFNITQNSSITATFTLTQYNLVIIKAGTGFGTITSNPSGIDCGSDCSEAYTMNTIVTLTAMPSSGSAFNGWSGDCTGSNLSVQIIMDTDKTCIATFVGLYSISGRVLSKIGWYYKPVADVTISLSETANITATTDSKGYFMLKGVPNGLFTLVPSKQGYNFTPVSRIVNVNGANVSGQNFYATYTGSNTYSISGVIKDSNGSPISGVTISLAGTKTASYITGSDGTYMFATLTNGTYTITPSKPGYTFSPPNRTVSISGYNVIGQDFLGTLNSGTYSISGVIMEKIGWRYVPISNVQVSLNDQNTSVMTDTKGRYIFTGLSNGTYLVRPTKPGYIFTPATKSITLNGSNITNINFIGLRVY